MREIIIERPTGKLRFLGDDTFKILQQEFEVITRLVTDEFTNAEKKRLEWRDVPCV